MLCTVSNKHDYCYWTNNRPVVSSIHSSTSVRIQLQGCCSEDGIYNSTSVQWLCPWSHANTSPMMNPTIYTSHLMRRTLWNHLRLTNQNLQNIKHNTNYYKLGNSLPLTEWVCPFSVHEIEGGSVERLNTDKFPSWDEHASLVLSSLENRIAVTRDQRIFDISDWLYKGHTCLFMLVKDVLHTAKLIMFS